MDLKLNRDGLYDCLKKKNGHFDLFQHFNKILNFEKAIFMIHDTPSNPLEKGVIAYERTSHKSNIQLDPNDRGVFWA